MKKDNIPLGISIKIRRTFLNLKIQDVAEILKVTPNKIGYLEKARKDDVFIKYLKFLKRNGVDLNKLFDE